VLYTYFLLSSPNPCIGLGVGISRLHRGQDLCGRQSECEALERLLDEVRGQHSRVLILRGEAGIGKTTLLEYLASKASGFRILRAAGVESEMELPFAGLHQLCTTILPHLAHLPAPQRDALGTAFGLHPSAAADRFLVGLAVLSLLSRIAEERPLVCLIEDAQWLDRASAQVLGFVARRLLAEPLAMVFAVREPAEELELANLPIMVIGGLNDSDARVLLDSVIPGRIDERVRDRIVAESRGNPLALLELPHGRTAAELAGGFGLPGAGPLGSVIEQSFLRRVRSLPHEAQQLLLTAAAEPLGDVPLLWRAAQRLGITEDAATAAESAGLIELGFRVRFRHPLVRSATYRAATASQRQEVHRALAEATDSETDPDRRAWHRAQATIRTNEAVAAELERSADRAQARGGIAAAAAFLERASELTPDRARRAARALAAAQAKFEAGAPTTADQLLAAAEIGPLDELQRARVARLRGEIVFARSRGNEAPPLLLGVAKGLEPLDPGLARETYLEALGAAIFAGRLSRRPGLREAAWSARAAARTGAALDHPRAMDLLLKGLAERFTEGFVAGLPPLKRALLAFREADRRDAQQTRWLWLACRVAPELWDDDTWQELAARGVRATRDAGALTLLPIALTYRAGVHVHAGEFAAASALVEEADAISQATGNAPVSYTSLVLAAWRGQEAPALELISEGLQGATARGEGRMVALAEYATAVLYNGLGRYDESLAAAQRGCEYEDLGLFSWSLTELIEAGARVGATDAAKDALRRLEEHTLACGTEWALGTVARARAFVSEGDTADMLYREGIERLQRSRMAVHLARAHLVYGEWLRRENQRVEAREQLRLAYETLRRMGAEAFAERARRELLATGETVRKRSVKAREVLTPQEAMVARLAAEGRTNPEIGTQLFISPRTAEYHLHKVFTKLGISSRRALRSALRVSAPADSAQRAVTSTH
jgi:DNA-binding CsgD family transcriptional regulator